MKRRGAFIIIAALAAIPPAFSDCRLTIDDPFPYEDRLVITIGLASHHRQLDCHRGHGWRYPDPADRTTVELCPDTCADFRAARQLTVEQRCPAL